MFSQTVEYSLRAVVYLADRTGTPCSVQEMARVTRVPQSYLSKVMQRLSRAGVVRSQRGLHGGFTLVKPPDEVTVLEVVNAVEPIRRITTCPLGLEAHGSRLCPLHSRLDQALAQVEQAFSRTTLAEILAEPSESIPLCDFPHTEKTTG